MSTIKRWRSFGASDAAAITGMAAEQQRIRRARKQLTPLARAGKASFSAPLLGEMMFVQEASKLGLGTSNLTVRAVAARWIAYWAMLTEGAQPEGSTVEERARAARRLLQLQPNQKAPKFAVLPIGNTPNWHNVVWDHSTASIEKGGGLSVAINLQHLGEKMAAKAGYLVENDE